MDFSHWIDKDRKDGGRRTREWFGKGSVLVLRSQVTGSELSCSKEGNIGAKGSKQVIVVVVVVIVERVGGDSGSVCFLL